MVSLTIVSFTSAFTGVPSFLMRDLIHTLTLETEDGSFSFFFCKIENRLETQTRKKPPKKQLIKLINYKHP